MIREVEIGSVWIKTSADSTSDRFGYVYNWLFSHRGGYTLKRSITKSRNRVSLAIF